MTDRKTQKAAKLLTSISKERLIRLVRDKIGYGGHHATEVVDNFREVLDLVAKGEDNE